MTTDESVPSVSLEVLASWLAEGRPVQVIDVRRASAFEKNPRMIANALRVLLDQIECWVSSQPERGLVVAYCVYGHEVSQGVVSVLHRSGFNAQYLEGGIYEWQLEGGASEAARTGHARQLQVPLAVGQTLAPNGLIKPT